MENANVKVSSQINIRKESRIYGDLSTVGQVRVCCRALLHGGTCCRHILPHLHFNVASILRATKRAAAAASSSLIVSPTYITRDDEYILTKAASARSDFVRRIEVLLRIADSSRFDTCSPTPFSSPFQLAEHPRASWGYVQTHT